MLDPSIPRPDLGPDELDVRIEHPAAGCVLLVVDGEIDALTTGVLRCALDRLLAEPPGGLIIDLTGVTFLASSGLAVLIQAAQRAGGRRLRLVTDSRAVRRPMEITGTDRLFDLYPDRTNAIAAPD